MKTKMENQLLHLREAIENKEVETLFRKASFSKEHQRIERKEDDHRLPYKRDVDRILHSKAYSRYSDKTQVAYLIQNDHISHRSLHVQLVSNFARGIAELLRLNIDLVEAIALGHDVGHSPFGHEGESYLNELSNERGAGNFVHTVQSCRLLSFIEPLNLGVNVYDGFLCHDGGMQGSRLVPQFGKTLADHREELKRKKEFPDENIMPGTLEGCLVKICDTISYLSRDIQDAITMGIIGAEEVPKTLLGTTSRDILNSLAQNLIENSYDQEAVILNEEHYAALKEIRVFNFERIYSHPNLKIESKKIKKCFRILFDHLLSTYERQGEESPLWRKFLNNKNEKYLDETSNVEKVIDYISGMTDNYFIHIFEQLIVPKKNKLL